MVRLPAEYQEVEYLESTGDQYIDTGYFPNNTTKVLCDFLAPKASNNALLGCRDGGAVGALDFDAIVYDTGRYGLIIRFNSKNQNSGTFSINTRYALNIESGRIALNDTVFSTYEPTEFQCTKMTLTIFARNLNGELIKGLVRIYCFKIWDNDILALNLIPCYRKSDSEPGMYDTVSGVFFTNQGTGTFIVGNDVSWDTASLIERRRQILLNTPHLTTISDTIASFKTDVSALVKDCKVYFNPVQEGSGDPSPDNVRPISGWDGVELHINNTSLTIPFPKTIYGGYVDLVNGEIHSNMALVTFDGSSDESWLSESLAYGTNFYISMTRMTGIPTPKRPQNASNSTIACNQAIARLPSQSYNPGYFYVATGGALNVYLGSLIGISSVSEWQSYLAEHPLQLVYELETPVTYQITPQIISTRRGINNIWSDVNGDISIKYWGH